MFALRDIEKHTHTQKIETINLYFLKPKRDVEDFALAEVDRKRFVKCETVCCERVKSSVLLRFQLGSEPFIPPTLLIRNKFLR